MPFRCTLETLLVTCIQGRALCVAKLSRTVAVVGNFDFITARRVNSSLERIRFNARLMAPRNDQFRAPFITPSRDLIRPRLLRYLGSTRSQGHIGDNELRSDYDKLLTLRGPFYALPRKRFAADI